MLYVNGMGLGWMVIIGHRSSKSTFGANNHSVGFKFKKILRTPAAPPEEFSKSGMFSNLVLPPTKLRCILTAEVEVVVEGYRTGRHTPSCSPSR